MRRTDTQEARDSRFFSPESCPCCPRRPEDPPAPASAPCPGFFRLTSNRRTIAAAASRPAPGPAPGPASSLASLLHASVGGGASRLSWRHAVFVLRVVPERSNGGTATLWAEVGPVPVAVAA